MIISRVLFTVITLFYAYRGFRQGLWRSISSIVAVVLAYIAAWLWSDDAAAWLSRETQVQGMAAWLGSALVIFFLVNLLISGLFRLLSRRQNKHGIRPLWSSVAGALVGAGIGATLGMVAVFALVFIRDLLPSDAPDATRPSYAMNGIERASRNLAGMLAEQIGRKRMDPASAKVGAALVREPAKVVTSVQQLARSNAMTDLLRKSEALRDRSADNIMQSPEFKRLLNNPHMRDLLSTAGIEDLESEAAQQRLAEITGRLTALRSDPRVQEILRDPQLQAQIESGNPLALMSNPKLMELFNIVFGGEEPKDGALIYRWIDQQGEVHYSDSPPPEDEAREVQVMD